mmetsp:Transcript_31842/g.61327  ORF Transcript_31842/g.61327 Transcript_31842/m.61327 type:complete len:213 (+) Transcript_31842:776-1414(+)
MYAIPTEPCNATHRVTLGFSRRFAAVQIAGGDWIKCSHARLRGQRRYIRQSPPATQRLDDIRELTSLYNCCHVRGGSGLHSRLRLSSRGRLLSGICSWGGVFRGICSWGGWLVGSLRLGRRNGLFSRIRSWRMSLLGGSRLRRRIRLLSSRCSFLCRGCLFTRNFLHRCRCFGRRSSLLSGHFSGRRVGISHDESGHSVCRGIFPCGKCCFR